MIQIPAFLIGSAVCLAVSASENDRSYKAAIGIAAYAMAYLMPDFLETYRGAFYRRPRMVLLVITAIVLISVIVRTVLSSYGAITLGLIANDIGFGTGALVIAIALDDAPPRDKSKKSKTSEALRRVIEKVTSIHSAPKPVPVRA